MVSSTVRHVQSGTTEGWKGWDEERLLSFIKQRGEIDTGLPESEPGDPLPEEPLESGTRDGPQPVLPVAFTQIRADRLLFPGSGPTVATVTLDVSELSAHDISPTVMTAEVYGQRPPFSKSRLLGRGRTRLRGENQITLDIDLLDPVADSQLELFAVLTFLDGADVKSTIPVVLVDARLTFRSLVSTQD